MGSWVTIDHLQKTMDDFTLGPFDLQLEAGTITTLIGSNGSGKSTLLKLIMNLAKPDAGSIKLFQEATDSPAKNWKPHVAYMPQTTMGVSQFTAEGLKDLTSIWYPNWNEDLFQNMLHQWAVPLNKKYSKLSQGLKQKLNLALTISSQASLMIFDEPTSFLDIPSTKMLGDILTDSMESGERSILMTSHQVEDIRKLSDYLVIIHNGSMLGQFEKGELIARYKRYWLKSDLPAQKLPGEMDRGHRQVVTNNPQTTESFFIQQNIDWYDHESLDLEEIITLFIGDNT